MTDQPEILRSRLLSMQVCVPKTFTTKQITDFANSESPTGIESRWEPLDNDDPALTGDGQRVQCQEREGCCHIVLGC